MGETQFSFRDEKMLVDALNQAFATYGALTPSEISRIISGLVTDGDLRRIMEKGKDISQMNASNMMAKNPKTITKETLAAKAVQIMEQHSITSLVVSKEDEIEGIIHLHDILKAGVV